MVEFSFVFPPPPSCLLLLSYYKVLSHDSGEGQRVRESPGTSSHAHAEPSPPAGAAEGPFPGRSFPLIRSLQLGRA